ncbi:transporter substrate-binding domain-containing protein [Zooshikella marina]|uniref:transporter substrate-binding domain-containing protein n=1 Tax=Zooshikella ganghwensis TaxID=202772 RepID=UPI001BB0A865|nr:transporter substrate-binding domain-containing protein [Zooshikella ganghwensis]MBU2708214.1 transporter substrate-binding domain-containing protein [Zooshikella ganghwensis]
MYKVLLKKVLISLVVCFSISLGHGSETIDFAVANWPPYFDKKAPNKGIMAQHLTQIFTESNISFNFIWYSTWKAAYNNAAAAKNIASPGWICSPKRAKLFYFSYPIYKLNHVFFHLKSKPVTINNVSDLKKYEPIAVTEAYYYSREFQEAVDKYKITLRKVRLEELTFNLLLKNRAAIAPMSKNNGLSLLEKHFTLPQREQITYSKSPFPDSYFHIMIPRKHPKAHHIYQLINSILIDHSTINKKIVGVNLKVKDICPHINNPPWK